MSCFTEGFTFQTHGNYEGLGIFGLKRSFDPWTGNRSKELEKYEKYYRLR